MKISFEIVFNHQDKNQETPLISGVSGFGECILWFDYLVGWNTDLRN